MEHNGGAPGKELSHIPLSSSVCVQPINHLGHLLQPHRPSVTCKHLILLKSSSWTVKRGPVETLLCSVQSPGRI